MKRNELIAAIESGKFDNALIALSNKSLEKAKARYISAINEFAKNYNDDRDLYLFSSPGRSEICGNHTDHNGGKAVAAAINLDIIAIVAKNEKDIIRIKSEGYKEDVVSLRDLEPHADLSSGLIAGVCDGFVKNGFKIAGFDAYTTSIVPKGSGLSSSAAFENLVGAILNSFFNENKVSAEQLARISQYSENVFFGKPCGLMDQLASSVGDMIAIDFTEGSFDKTNYNFDDMDLFIIKTKSDHASLSDEYSAIREEMMNVAAFFGKKQLRECDKDSVIARAADIKSKLGDRAFLRALHFFADNSRVETVKTAIKTSDKALFLNAIKGSGLSSQILLQNIYCNKTPKTQPLGFTLALCEEFLGDKEAAWRVHGGGFAGTVQAFVPKSFSDEFERKMNTVLGEGSALRLEIRKYGVTEVCTSLIK